MSSTAKNQEPRTPQASLVPDPEWNADEDLKTPSPPRTPKDPDADTSSSPSTPVVSSSASLPPLPALSLPPAAKAGPSKKKTLPPIPGQDFRIPRTQVFASPPRKLPVIPLSAQKHIQRTVHRRETSAARHRYRKQNKPWECKACKAFCYNSTSKEAHLKTRSHWLKTKAKILTCIPCDFSTTSPEDFARHKNGKKHKSKVAWKKNRL